MIGMVSNDIKDSNILATCVESFSPFGRIQKSEKKNKKKEKEKNFAQRRSFENDDFIGLAMEHRVVCRLCLDTHESMFRISIVTCA